MTFLVLFFQVMQMFKGCRKEDTAPHIYGTAQAAYRHLLTTRQDQSIILLGKSGSGKTTNCQHIIQYLLTIAGSTNKTFSGWSNSPKFQVRNNIVIQFLFVVCSREMAGGLHRVRGIWECVHLSEWKCQSLLPCCFFGLWPGRSGDFSLHSGSYSVLSLLSDYSCTCPVSNAIILFRCYLADNASGEDEGDKKTRRRDDF